MWESALTRLDVAVAVLVILSALKSGYNGHLRTVHENIKQLPQIADEVERISERQEKMVEGMVALSVVEDNDDATIDTEQLAADLRDGESYRAYITRDSTRNGATPYTPAEEIEEEEEMAEEESRWRERYDDD